MKKIILLLALTSCDNYYEKPFIIVGKTHNYTEGVSWYCYSDKAHHLVNFKDKNDTYNIGDTLK